MSCYLSYKLVFQGIGMVVAHRSKLSDQIYDQIRGSIESEEWQSGMRIATELELSEQYGVSRPVVREALARLKSENLIDSKRGSGSFVTKPSGGIVRGFRPVGTVADLIHGFEFRLSVEGDTARFAAVRRNDAQLAEIQAAASLLSDESIDEKFGDADFRFHLAIAEATGNSMYVSTMTMLRDQILFGMRLTGGMAPPRPDVRVRIVRDEHRRIVDAIAAKDPDAAHAAISDHLKLARTRLLGFEPTADQF
jgi:GntR family transcriptional regulator, transcriptional repressor for pyruvate dehydrogenase complex